MRRMGEEAAELLIQRVTEAQRTPPVSRVLPVEVTRRGSCGCGEPSGGGASGR